jgi:SAM-dependent methyltransferase
MLTLDRQERYRQRLKQITPGYRPALEVYKAIITGLVQPDTVLLDAGCGEGGLTTDYQEQAKQVVGIDRYLIPIRNTIHLKNIADADLIALPFPDQTFSLITCSWVLEHLRQPEDVFREITRVLKPGGHFVFITPNTYNYLIWARRLIPNRVSTPVVDKIYQRGEDYIFPTFYRANTRRSIDGYLVSLGYTCHRFEYVSDPTYTAFNEPLFRLSMVLEKVLDVVWKQSHVHLVGCYQKGG